MTNFRLGALTDIVEFNGNHYYIDSVDTFDCGYETMIFPCDEKGKVTSWSELYCERYDNATEMEARHKEIVSNLGAVLEC